MAERDSLYVNSLLDVEEARVGIGALITPATSAVKALTGLRPGAANAGQVTATGTPDANVNVAPFQAILQDVRGTVGGTYVLTLDSVKTVNILAVPAHASLARRDLIIAWQKDAFYGDADSKMEITPVRGTPSGSPADPSLASYPNAITLARVTVAANATTITSGAITDLRPAWTVALGGLLPVASSTVRNALTGLYDGRTIYRQDRDWVEVYDGAAWRVQGVAKVSNFADLSAITSPYAGQLATSGDGSIYRHDGTAWRYQTYRVQTLLSSTTASVTFSSIPSSLRHIRITWTARSDQASTVSQWIYLRVNGDTGANYRYQYIQGLNNAATAPSGIAVNQIVVGHVPGATGLANNYATGVIDIPGWNAPHSTFLGLTFNAQYLETASTSLNDFGGGHYSQAGAYTSITLLPQAGNFTSGSEFLLIGTE